MDDQLSAQPPLDMPPHSQEKAVPGKKNYKTPTFQRLQVTNTKQKFSSSVETGTTGS